MRDMQNTIRVAEYSESEAWNKGEYYQRENYDDVTVVDVKHKEKI